MRRWPRPLDDRLEEAVLEGDYRKARRLARRKIRRDPTSSDARFFEILSLQKLGEHRKALEAARTARSRLPEPQVTAIAYVAASSAVTLDRRSEAMKWVPLGEKDPDVARRIRSDPTTARLVPDLSYQ